MLTNSLYLLILLAGFPTGLLLTKLCKDEIKAWKKRLFIISAVCLAAAIGVSFIPLTIFLYKFPVIISLFFVIIVCLTVIWKAH